MAAPKKKVSQSRRDMRRSHISVEPKNLVACPNCGEAKLQHNVCTNCGVYNGHQILKDKRQEA